MGEIITPGGLLRTKNYMTVLKYNLDNGIDTGFEELHERNLCVRVPMVYFIKSGRYLKIGTAEKGFGGRLKGYITHNPEFSLFAIRIARSTYECYELEKVYKNHFREYMYRGDWFASIPDDDLSYIEMNDSDRKAYRILVDAIGCTICGRGA